MRAHLLGQRIERHGLRGTIWYTVEGLAGQRFNSLRAAAAGIESAGALDGQLDLAA